MYKMFNLKCQKCAHLFEALTAPNDPAPCPECGSKRTAPMPGATKTFSVIQATTLTSGRFKAGSIHKHHRAATKIQVQVPNK